MHLHELLSAKKCALEIHSCLSDNINGWICLNFCTDVAAWMDKIICTFKLKKKGEDSECIYRTKNIDGNM